MSSFEGSFLGKHERIKSHTNLECGVCWWVYDPQQGDSVWQVPAGTAFTALPAHWRCPNCDAAQDQFMVVKGGEGVTNEAPNKPPCSGELNIVKLRKQLLVSYSAVDQRMRALPVYNSALEIAVSGLRRCPGGHAAVLLTPWCMNIIYLPAEDDAAAEGSAREHAFPSGVYPLVRGYLDGVGVVESCSLFSPMDQFESHAAALAVANEAVNALFTPPEKPVVADVDVGRRRFLGGAVRSGTAETASGASRHIDDGRRSR